jgi:hypothetical protein
MSDIPKEQLALPPRRVNGGLYTGEPARGPWGNVSIVPEAHIYQLHLPTELSPLGVYHIPGYTRPGNNTQEFPYHSKISDNLHIRCLQK